MRVVSVSEMNAGEAGVCVSTKALYSVLESTYLNFSIA